MIADLYIPLDSKFLIVVIELLIGLIRTVKRFLSNSFTTTAVFMLQMLAAIWIQEERPGWVTLSRPSLLLQVYSILVHVVFITINTLKLLSWKVTYLDYRITDWLRLAGTSGGHLVQPPAQAGIAGAGCPKVHPGGFWWSPRGMTLQPLQETSNVQALGHLHSKGLFPEV